jgi:hypothetical protein
MAADTIVALLRSKTRIVRPEVRPELRKKMTKHSLYTSPKFLSLTHMRLV